MVDRLAREPRQLVRDQRVVDREDPLARDPRDRREIVGERIAHRDDRVGGEIGPPQQRRQIAMPPTRRVRELFRERRPLGHDQSGGHPGKPTREHRLDVVVRGRGDQGVGALAAQDLDELLGLVL
ncbi:MAG: hypothetical protein N2038_15015, partial [Geminicoccaceae bacterium]|nr:hypothetical protein [Geminicoccaceae bacterium]